LCPCVIGQMLGLTPTAQDCRAAGPEVRPSGGRIVNVCQKRLFAPKCGVSIPLWGQSPPRFANERRQMNAKSTKRTLKVAAALGAGLAMVLLATGCHPASGPGARTAMGSAVVAPHSVG